MDLPTCVMELPQHPRPAEARNAACWLPSQSSSSYVARLATDLRTWYSESIERMPPISEWLLLFRGGFDRIAP